MLLLLQLEFVFMEKLEISYNFNMWRKKFRLKMYALRSVHTTPQLRCGADISITSQPQVTAASPHFKLN